MNIPGKTLTTNLNHSFAAAHTVHCNPALQAGSRSHDRNQSAIIMGNSVNGSVSAAPAYLHTHTQAHTQKQEQADICISLAGDCTCPVTNNMYHLCLKNLYFALQFIKSETLKLQQQTFPGFSKHFESRDQAYSSCLAMQDKYTGSFLFD